MEQILTYEEISQIIKKHNIDSFEKSMEYIPINVFHTIVICDILKISIHSVGVNLDNVFYFKDDTIRDVVANYKDLPVFDRMIGKNVQFSIILYEMMATEKAKEIVNSIHEKEDYLKDLINNNFFENENLDFFHNKLQDLHEGDCDVDLFVNNFVENKSDFFSFVESEIKEKLLFFNIFDKISFIEEDVLEIKKIIKENYEDRFFINIIQGLIKIKNEKAYFKINTKSLSPSIKNYEKFSKYSIKNAKEEVIGLIEDLLIKISFTGKISSADIIEGSISSGLKFLFNLAKDMTEEENSIESIYLQFQKSEFKTIKDWKCYLIRKNLEEFFKSLNIIDENFEKIVIELSEKSVQKISLIIFNKVDFLKIDKSLLKDKNTEEILKTVYEISNNQTLI